MDGVESKKRKRRTSDSDSAKNGIDTSKPTAVFKPTKGRSYTLSVALPGSIIANSLTHDHKTALAGQVARALAVFCVDEVIVYDDGHKHQNTKLDRGRVAQQDAESGYTAFADPNHFLYHILSYLETPPYLRKSLFPHHPNLRTAGALPSVDMPHHLRSEEWCQYREGVALASEASQNDADRNIRTDRLQNGRTAQRKLAYSSDPEGESNDNITYVNAGFRTPVIVYADIPPKTRLTLKFPETIAPTVKDGLIAEAVSPDAPREEGGYYWGYSSRIASSISCVFTESPHDDGYDFSIGTSERGESLRSFQEKEKRMEHGTPWKHLLVVFGGVSGLEKAVRNDLDLAEKGVTQPSALFDAWINLVEGQGSRTIRTEEALWIGLMGLREFVLSNRD